MVKGKYFAVDAHCHVYPEKIAAAAVGSTDRFYGTVSACDGTVSSLINIRRKSGIDKFIIQSVATTPKQVKSINGFIAATVCEHPDKFVGLGTLHPDSTDIAGDVEHILELGLKGVKLHPDIQGFKLDDYRCLKIYEQLEKHSLPLLLHTGDSRYDNSNPNRLVPIVDIYKGINFCAAHFGGWSLWETACEKLKDMSNLYVDCSSSFAYVSRENAKKIIRTYGADKVLFGTDYPMWEPESELDILLSLGLTDDEYRKILFENAKKLYGFDL